MLCCFDEFTTSNSREETRQNSPRRRLRAHSRNASYSFQRGDEGDGVMPSSSMKKASIAQQIWVSENKGRSDSFASEEDAGTLNESDLSVKSAPEADSGVLSSHGSSPKHFTIGPMTSLATGLQVKKTPSKPVPRLWNIFGDIERESECGDSEGTTQDEGGAVKMTAMKNLDQIAWL